MKRFCVLVATVVIFCCGSITEAQQRNASRADGGRNGGPNDGQGGQRGAGKRGGPGGGQRGTGGLFRVLDLDRDGNLSVNEIDGAVAALMKLDTNNDGKLDSQELVVRVGAGRGGQGGGGRQGAERGGQGAERGRADPEERPDTGQEMSAGKDHAALADTAKPSQRKPRIDDTIRANVYADNSFKLYVNGDLVAVDSVAFVPHNVVSVDVLPAYPMTIAVMAIDNADPRTGMEYANTNIGDGGFILKFGDGTVTNAKWKAKKLSWGPINGDTNNPRVENLPIPRDWYAVDFDDSEWSYAKEFSEEEIDPKGPFFEHDFEGAKFIWSDDVKLDNLVLFRTVVSSSPDGKDRPDFRGLTDIVPQGGGGRRGGGGGNRKPPR